MSTRVVKLDEFAGVLEAFALRSLAAKKAAVLRGLARSIPMLVARSPVDTGFYAASWGFNETEYGAIIGNYAPYAGVIEHGARPFTPPIGPLLAWAKRVLTGSRAIDENGQATGAVLRDTGQPETDYTPEVWALAKHVQAKITQFGMQPRNIMENAIPEIMDNIRQELQSLV